MKLVDNVGTINTYKPNDYVDTEGENPNKSLSFEICDNDLMYILDKLYHNTSKTIHNIAIDQTPTRDIYQITVSYE